MFFADLDEFRQLTNCLAVVKARCIVPHTTDNATNGGSVHAVLPYCYTYDAQSPPEGIYMEHFEDDYETFPTNSDLVASFNQTRDGMAPGYFFISVDDSQSMFMADIFDPANDDAEFNAYKSDIHNQTGC